MAGDWHESINKLVLDNPELAWEIYEIGRARAIPVCSDRWHLSDMSGRGRPVDSEVCLDSTTRAESIGAPIFKERMVDRMVRLAFADKTELMVICEVQSDWKKEKYFRLPGYVARAFEDYKRPVELVMICKTDALAARYREGVWFGEHTVVTPFALGPGDLWPVTDPEAEGQTAQMSVLTLLMQPRQEEGEQVDKEMEVLTARLNTIDPEMAGDYAYYLSKLKGEEFKVLMEETVRESDPEWWRRMTRRMAEESGLLEEGLEKGLEKGLEQGREEELRRDRATLYALLAGLAIETKDQARARIEACTDPDELAAWTTRVIRIRNADELFEDQPGSD